MGMSSKKYQIPAIRFEGFTDTWEQREFEDVIISIQTGTNLLGSESNHGTALIKMGNVQRGFFSFKKVEFLNENEQVEEKNMANFGDFLFNTRNTLELVGKGATWFGKNDEYAFNSNIARFTFEGINTTFFNYLYNTPQMIKQVQARAVGTTSVAAVYPKDLNSMKFWIPSANEQQKIGAFFKQLDDTIDLHQYQLDNYKVLKKALLKKIFNQELRFKDEHGNDYPKWINKTVNDIGDVVTGTTPSTQEKTYYNNGVYPWVTPTDIDRKNINSTPRKLTEQGLSKGRVLPENTILVTCIASIGKNAILKQKGSCNQQINAIVCNEKHNYEFVYYLMEKNTEVLKSLAGKGTMDIVNKDTFSKMQITIPCLEEQVRIGEFLSLLEGKIEDEQKLVNLMKKQKQGLMQQMFV